MENKIDEKTLKNLQELNSQFNTIKNQLGDLELQKHGLCLKVESLRGEFQVLEASLAEKHGKDAIVNLETGEVTRKEKEKEENG
tara:strand:- start:1404 stop:1655 length:252 start_codon:yes stop_codon:yes gene_type:complete